VRHHRPAPTYLKKLVHIVTPKVIVDEMYQKLGFITWMVCLTKGVHGSWFGSLKNNYTAKGPITEAHLSVLCAFLALGKEKFYIMKASSTSSQKIDPRHCTPGGHLICDVAPLPPIGCWPEPGSHRHVDQPHHVSTTAGLKHADFGDFGPSEVASGCLQEFTPPHS
jgi:hypothetical protein